MNPSQKFGVLPILGVPEILCTRFVRKPGNRGILQFSGILSISNLRVFSADVGFDISSGPQSVSGTSREVTGARRFRLFLDSNVLAGGIVFPPGLGKATPSDPTARSPVVKKD
jgi:hypothetical protein